MYKNEKNYITDIYGEDLRPKHKVDSDDFKVVEDSIKIPSYLSTPSPEMATKIAEAKERFAILRETSVNEKPEFFNDLQRLNIEIINDTPPGWNLFDDPSEAEIMDLMRSIESVGLIYPIHVLENECGRYSVICGRFRLEAFSRLFKITGLEKYKTIPCYVIKENEVDELYLRNFIYESNIVCRSISKINKIQTLIQNYEIMRRTKQHRNEKNIAMELAKQFEISESTTFNYLKVRKLCDSALHYLYDERITLKAALYLTRVSKDLQENILEHFGVEAVNAIFRLKLLTSKDGINLEALKEKINMVNELTPETTKITLEVHRALLNALIELLLIFKKTEASEYAGSHTKGKFNHVLKFSCNKDDMRYYLEKGMINEVSLKKLLASSVQDMAKAN